MLRFIAENRGDAQVESVVAKHGIPVDELMAAAGATGAVESASESVTTAIRNKTFGLGHLRRLREIPSDVIWSSSFLCSLNDVLGESATPEVYELVVSDERVAAALDWTGSAYVPLVYTAVNNENEALLIHLKGVRNRPHVRRAFDYVRHVGQVFKSVGRVRLILQHCDPPDATVDAIENAAVESFNVEVLELLSSSMTDR